MKKKRCGPYVSFEFLLLILLGLIWIQIKVNHCIVINENSKVALILLNVFYSYISLKIWTVNKYFLELFLIIKILPTFRLI